MGHPAAPHHGAYVHHRGGAPPQAFQGIRDRRLKALIIDRREVSSQCTARGRDGHIDHVPGNLYVAGPLLRQHLRDHTIDLIRGNGRVGQHRLRTGQFLEDHELGVKTADLVMEEHVSSTLARARRPGDDEQGHLLSPCPRDGIGNLEPPHAVRDGNNPEPLEPGVGIGGKGRTLLISRDEQGEAHLLEISKQTQGVVTDNPKSTVDTAVPQAVRQMLRDRQVTLDLGAAHHASSSGCTSSSTTSTRAPAAQPTKRRP